MLVAFHLVSLLLFGTYAPAVMRLTGLENAKGTVVPTFW